MKRKYWIIVIVSICILVLATVMLSRCSSNPSGRQDTQTHTEETKKNEIEENELPTISTDSDSQESESSSDSEESELGLNSQESESSPNQATTKSDGINQENQSNSKIEEFPEKSDEQIQPSGEEKGDETPGQSTLEMPFVPFD